MYKRESNSGHVISWNPDDKEKAAKAVSKVEGTNINSVSEAKENYAEVDKETANEIRALYEELIR